MIKTIEMFKKMHISVSNNAGNGSVISYPVKLAGWG